MRLPAITLALLCAGVTLLPGQTPTERIDHETYWNIRREATSNSQIMRTLHFLTDVYGPRLTGSPNFKGAADWVVRQLSGWGITNSTLEPWEFGRPGWVNERASVHIVAPVKDTLVCEVVAWTPGTEGPVTAKVAQLIVPSQPTKEALERYLASVPVAGRIVLVGQHTAVPVTFDAPAKRRELSDVTNDYDPSNPAAGTPRSDRRRRPVLPGTLSAIEVSRLVDQHLVANGAIARVNDAGRAHGQIRAFQNRAYDPSKAVPTIVIRNEDYGRISRILADGGAVELQLDVVNRHFPEGTTAYNVVAELAGSDKGDELVMLGAHLDSWHAGTGATDNAIGSAVVIEAMRILQALGVKPRRAVRLALWSGEEQGLLGSKAYVARHFGTFEQPKPQYNKLAGYFNIDSGTGRVRGFTVFGPPEAATVLREALAPFSDLGFAGVVATKSRRSGSTDSTSFNAAGLPGIGSGQDPIEYDSHTWHTNLDTYERVVEGDAIQAATVIAAGVYHLAMRDQILPRLRAADMPPAQGARPATTTAGQDIR